MAALGQRPDLLDDGAHRHRARIAAAIRDDAEGATVVATVLHLHEHARQAALEAFDEMRRHFPHRHDVGDRDLVAHDAGIEHRARIAPGRAAHLVVIADDAVDLGHVGKHFRLRLRRAAGDDDARLGPLALEAADRLPRLRHRLVGDGAAVDDDGVGKARAFRLAPDHLGFERVEAAAKGDDLDRHVLKRRWRTAPDRTGLRTRTRPFRSSAHDRHARATR